MEWGGLGRVGQGWAHGVPKTELRFADRIRGSGLGMSLGHGEV